MNLPPMDDEQAARVRGLLESTIAGMMLLRGHAALLERWRDALDVGPAAMDLERLWSIVGGVVRVLLEATQAGLQAAEGSRDQFAAMLDQVEAEARSPLLPGASLRVVDGGKAPRARARYCGRCGGAIDAAAVDACRCPGGPDLTAPARRGGGRDRGRRATTRAKNDKRAKPRS